MLPMRTVSALCGNALIQKPRSWHTFDLPNKEVIRRDLRRIDDRSNVALTLVQPSPTPGHIAFTSDWGVEAIARSSALAAHFACRCRGRSAQGSNSLFTSTDGSAEESRVFLADSGRCNRCVVCDNLPIANSRQIHGSIGPRVSNTAPTTFQHELTESFLRNRLTNTVATTPNSAN